MAEREGATLPADAPKDLAPVVASEEIPSRNDSTAPTPATAATGGRELGLELRIPPSPSISLPAPASVPQEYTTRPPFTSPSHPPVSYSQDSTAQPPQAPSPVESSTGNRSDVSATDSSRKPESPSPHPVQRSTGTGPVVSPLETLRPRTRVRAPVESLPPAFPPPRRVSESDGDGSSSTSSQSPLAPTGPGVEEEGGGLEGRELDVNASGTSELELSVPSHKEHLTADGQRYTTYEVVVRMGGRQWSVRKRYSQFDQFRMSLRKQHKEVGSFRFPNKSKFNTFSEHTKERRRTGFDEFLRLVAGLHPRPQEVDVFLAMDEHGAGVRGGAGNRPMAWTSAKVFPVDTPAGPEVGRTWSETGRSQGGRRLLSGSGVDRPTRGGTLHRVPRFPPLADQGRSEKAAEAAAAVAAAAAAAASSRSGLSSVVHQADVVLRKLLGPDLLSMLCVVAVSAVSIVAVWKIGGKPGIATLVVGVCVGLFVQNWDRGFDVFNLGLELIGMGPETSEPPPPAREPTGPHSSGYGRVDRPRAESAGGALGGSRQVQTDRKGGRQ